MAGLLLPAAVALVSPSQSSARTEDGAREASSPALNIGSSRWGRPVPEAVAEDDLESGEFRFTTRSVFLLPASDESIVRRMLERLEEIGAEEFDFSLHVLPRREEWSDEDMETFQQAESARVVMLGAAHAWMKEIDNTEDSDFWGDLKRQAIQLDEQSLSGAAPSPAALRIVSEEVAVDDPDGAWVLRLKPGTTAIEIRDWVRINAASRYTPEIVVQVAPSWEGVVARGLSETEISTIWLDESGRRRAGAGRAAIDDELFEARVQRLFGRIAVEEFGEGIEEFPLDPPASRRFSPRSR